MTPSTRVLEETQFSQWPRFQGKVRDVYDLGEQLLFVATDRISAFDWNLVPGIPEKGRVLTALSHFWFNRLGEPHHLLATSVQQMPAVQGLSQEDRAMLAGRTMLVRKAEVAPIECVVRGYLAGSGWKEYQAGGAVCGVPLPGGLRQADRLPEPIFTPATKATDGHDQNISFDEMIARVGAETAQELRRRSLALYQRAAEIAQASGLILADTKLEWGRTAEGWILVDEIFTPDSSRYWPADEYHPGGSPPSFDKQFVRDWLETTGWDKNSPPPRLPDDVVAATSAKYREAYARLVGRPFRPDWSEVSE